MPRRPFVKTICRTPGFQSSQNMYICTRRAKIKLHRVYFLRELRMADTFSKPSNVHQKLKWARIWFSKLMNFHGIDSHKADHWDFSADHVIAFLRFKRDAKTPAWKRLKILEAIMNYRVVVQQRRVDFLVPVRNKMRSGLVQLFNITIDR